MVWFQCQENRFYFVLFLWLICLRPTTIVAVCPGVTRKAISQIVNNVKFPGPFMYSAYLSYDKCQLYCLDFDECLSFTYHEATNQCFLMDSNKLGDTKLVSASGWITAGQQCSTSPCVNGGRCIQLTDNANPQCLCTVSWVGTICNVYKYTAFGVQSRAIPDSAMTASTHFVYPNNNCYPHFGRLHKSGNSWCSATKSLPQWLEVAFGRKKAVARVATQGRSTEDQWVTSYSLKYRIENNVLVSYQNDKVFQGNRDRGLVAVKHDIDPVFEGYSIRFVTRSVHDTSCMRVEIYGYNVPPP